MPSPSETPKQLRNVMDRVLTGVTRTPQFEAMFTDSRIIPTSWGNLASQAVEAGFVEPDPQVISDYFGINREALRDSTLQFRDEWHLSGFKSGFIKRTHDREHSRLTQGNEALTAYIEEAVSGWRIEDGEEQADKIQEEISAIGNGKFIQDRTPEEQLRANILCQRRDALYSGIAVSLPDFVRTVLSYDGVTVFSAGEIATSLSKMMHYLIASHFGREIPTPDVPASEILLGEENIEDFTSALETMIYQKANNTAWKKWDEIESFLIAPPPEEHFIFKGGEK